jgi:hypothetical protein
LFYLDNDGKWGVYCLCISEQEDEMARSKDNNRSSIWFVGIVVGLALLGIGSMVYFANVNQMEKSAASQTQSEVKK